MELENIIRAGLEELKLLTPEQEARIQFFSSSLFSLYHAQTEAGDYGVKVMKSSKMAVQEAEGLRALGAAGCLVPEVFGTFSGKGHALLIMEFLAPANRINGRTGLLENLKQLYSHTGESWGWKNDNFIGSLPQSNGLYESFTEFWWDTRIRPQSELAVKQKRLEADFPGKAEKMIAKCSKRWGLERQTPVLIHGDLWSGNVLSAEGGVYLIDPSVAYGNPEQDLAMLELFGSALKPEDMSKLSREYGMPEGYEERVSFWQLYPLLVHVNLFGGSYVSSAKGVLRKYS